MLRLPAMACCMLLFLTAIPASAYDIDYYNNDRRELLENIEMHHLYKCHYLAVSDGVKSLLKDKEYMLALGELRYTLERVPNHPIGLEYMVELSRRLKDPQWAMIYFKKAIKAFPQYAVTHFQFGSFLLESGDPDEAVKELKIAVEIDPTFAAAHAALAKAYRNKGEAGLAQKAEEKAKSLGYKGVITDDVSEIVLPNPPR